MSDSFERVGLELEIRGFEEYVQQLGKIVDKQDSAAASADLLTDAFTRLEAQATQALKTINNAQFNPNAMGVGQFSDSIISVANNITRFEERTRDLLQNTGALQAGFDRIQTSLQGLDLTRLTDQAGRAAENIEKLAVAFAQLEAAMGGNKLVTNLGKLIPLLLAAGDIRKLGDVGRGIKSILTSLASIDKIPDFATNQKNFNELVQFMERLSKLKIPQGLGGDLVTLSNALDTIIPTFARLSKVSVPQYLVQGISDLLTVFDKFKTLDFVAMKNLSEVVHNLGVAFRTFGAGAAGERFTGSAIKIADTIERILVSLRGFVSDADAPLFINLIERLGNSLREFARGMSALGRDFNNTFANIPNSITNITQAIDALQQTLGKIKDVDRFSLVLESVAKGFLALSKAFASLGRSKSIQTDLEKSIKAIVDSILRLSASDIQNAAVRIKGLVGPITELSEALRILRKQRISDEMVTRFRDLSGQVGLLERAVRAVSATFQAFGAAVAKAFASLGSIALTGLANLLLRLRDAFGQLIIALLKLPFTLVSAGFRLIAGGLNVLFAPIRLLIDLLGKLQNMFTSLFNSKSRNVGSGLGLDAAAKDVSEFETRIDSVQRTLYQTQSAASAGGKGVRDFGNDASRATIEVEQLNTRIQTLNRQSSLLGRIFGGSDIAQLTKSFTAASIAADLVTDAIYGIAYGFGNLIRETVDATSRFEQLNLQLTSLQARETVDEGLFPDVPTALSEGVELLDERVGDLINEFRILAIQSPFETMDVTGAFRMANTMGFATEEAKELVRVLVDAGSASGWGGDDLQEVARIFGQIRGNGRLLAEEMNQLAERGIGVRKILGDLGVSAEDLEKSTINADDAIAAITNSLKSDFAGAAARSADSILGLVGSFQSFREEVLRTFAQPIVEALRPLAVGLADVLFTTEVFDRVESAGQRVALAVETIIVNIASIAGAIRSAFEAIPQPIKDFAVLLSQAAGAALAATSAVIALQAAIGLVAAALAFAFVNNPIGQLTAVVFVAIKIMNSLQTATLSTAESFELLGQIISNAFTQGITGLEALYDIQRLPSALRDVAFWLADIGARASGIYNALSALANIFVTAFANQSSTIDSVVNIVATLDSELVGLGSTVAAIGAQFGYFGNIIQEIGLVLLNILDPSDLEAISELFNMLPESAQNALRTFGINLNNFLNIFINWRTSLTNLFNGLLVAATNLGNNIGTSIRNAAQSINDALFNIAVGANNIIQNFFGTASGVADFLTTLVENVYTFGAGAVSAFASGMVSAVNLVVSAVEAIADAIAWLLQPGSPPRALPDIDEWGKAAGQEFVNGMSEADTDSILQIANNIQDTLGNIRIPAGASLEQIFETMNWSTDDAGNVVDALGNIIVSQDQLAQSASQVADELARVNAELTALEREQNIQKQQNLVDNLRAALRQPGISESNRLVLEQQLKRAELELRKLQLQAEEEGLTEPGTGLGGGLRPGDRDGSGGSTPKTKEPKAPEEPEQRFPKIDKAIKKTGKALKEALDISVPDVSPITAAFGDPDSGDGLLGRVTKAFTDAKENIRVAVDGIRTTILNTFNDLKGRLELVIAEIVRLAGEFAQAFSDAFGTLENQGPIVGGLAALATATYLAGGWGVLTIIAAGITALGAAWALASGQVDLNLPDNLQAFQDVIDRMREGFKGAKQQETFLPGIGKIQSGSNASLAASIMGFDVTKLPESFGALLASIETEVTTIFTEIDTAIGEAFKAYEAGENPVLAFFESLFDIEQIASTIRTEVAGLGELIGGIFSGELAKAFGGDGETGITVEEFTGESKIAQFIVGKFQQAADTIANTDFNKMFEEARLNIQTAFEGLFTIQSTEGLEGEAMGVDSTSPILTNILSMLDQINDIATTDTDWGQFGTDLQDLGIAFKEFGQSVGTLAGVAVGTTAAVSIIGSLELLTKAPSLAESVLQILDNLLRSLGNLIVAFTNLTNSEARTEAFTNFWTNFTGIFTEINEIQADAYDIVGDTVEGISRLVAAISGIADPEQFTEKYNAVLAVVTGLLTSIGTFLLSAAFSTAATALATQGPKMLEMIKNLSTFNKFVIALTGVTAALKYFDERNENVDLTQITNFLEQINGILIALSFLTAVPGVKKLQGGALKQITKLIPSIVTFFAGLRLMRQGFPVQGPRLPGGGFTRWQDFLIKASNFVKTAANAAKGIYVQFLWRWSLVIWPAITGFFAAAGSWIAGIPTALAGGGAATAGTVLAGVTALAAIVAGFVNAWVNDFGGIKTNILESLTESLKAVRDFWNALVDIVANFGDDELRYDAIDRGDEALTRFVAWGLKFNNFFRLGTPENTQVWLATIEGFLDLIDKVFGTDYASKINDIFAPLRSILSGDTDGMKLLGNSIVNIGTAINRLIAINIQPLDNIIITILSLIDSIRRFGEVQFSKIAIGVQIINEILALAANPFSAGNRIPAIHALIEELNAINDVDSSEFVSFADNYEAFVERFRQPITIEPEITIDPTFVSPFQNRSETGWFTPETFGGTSTDGDGNIQVPIELAPEFTVDNTTLDTNVTALKTKLDTDYAAIAAIISQSGATGADGFVTELGTLPTEVVVPLDELLSTINGYGGENGEITIAGTNLGVDFATGYIAGIDSKKDELIAAVSGYIQAGLITIETVQDSSSPSKETEKLGLDFGEGFIKGVGSPTKRRELMGVAARFAQAAVDGVVDTIGSSRNQQAINRVIAALLPDVFQDRGLKIDFSNWEIISDSETDVTKRATETATNIAEQFGNSFARVTNQIFDSLVAFDPSLAPDLFHSEDINKAFTEQIDAIFKHRDDTLAQLNAEGKEQFNRNFLAAFTDPEGLRKISEDFVAQFSDTDLLNLPKVYGAIDSFVGTLRARLEERANQGDPFAFSMLGGLEDLRAALGSEVQTAIDELSKEGEESTAGASRVGSAVASNIAAGTTSQESLGGINTAVTTLTSTLVTTIQTEFAKITEAVTTQGNASATGFMAGINSVKEALPVSKDEIIELLNSFEEEFTNTGTALGDDWSLGYAAGMITAEALKEVYDAAFKVGQTAKQGTADGQNSASPSKDAMKLGQDFGDGYVLGILSTLPEVVNAGLEMTTAAANAINEGLSTSAPIISNALEGAIRQGTFWIDENVKVEPVDTDSVEEAVESMNALERATERAEAIFDSFGQSFGNTFDSVFDKFLELNPDAINDIWDIRPIRDAATGVATELRDMLDAIGEELTPSGQSRFAELLRSVFGDEETISTFVETFINSFSPEELAELPDAAKAIDTFVRQIEDVFLEDDDYEGFLRDLGLTEDLTGGLSQLTNTLKEEIQNALDEIKRAEEEANPVLPDWIASLFGPLPEDQTAQVGEDLAAGIAEGITSPTSMNALSSAAQTAIDLFMNELRNAGDIHSPSRLTMKLAGEPLVDGIIVGMRNRMPSVLKTARNIGDSVAHSFGSGDWLRQNTLDQRVNLKYNNMVNALPELFQDVNRRVIGGASKLKDNMLMSGEYNARTGMLTNYSVVHNNTSSQDEYHLHMDVDKQDMRNVRRGFRVAKQLGIN